jgi:hypothetical protein
MTAGFRYGQQRECDGTGNIHEAKTHLPQLVDRTIRAQEHSRVGFLKDQLRDFKVPEDFDTMMQDDIIGLFEGGREGER